MSKRQETIVFNLQANVEQIKQSANEINSVFSKLNLPQNVQASFSKTFNKLTEDIRTFEAHAGKGFKNLADTKKAEKNIETIVTDFEKLRVQVKDVKGLPADKLLPKEVLDRIKQYKDLLEKANKLTLKDNSSDINKAADAVKRAQQKFDDNEQSIKKNNAAIRDNENRYKELSQYISNAEASLKSLVTRREELKNKKNRTADEASEYAILDTRIKAVKSSLTSYNKELISNEANGKKLEETQSQLSLSAVTLQENLNKTNQELTNIKNSSAVTDSELQNLKQSLANIANVDPGTLPETLQGLITKIQALSADASNIDAIKNALGELESKLHSAADSAQQTGQTFHNTTTQSVEDMIRANSEMDQLKSRLTYFFSAMNGVQLFKRAIRSAYESVKELDAAITEMAVVTDYSINDIWGNIPEYTRTATELGATTKDVINSMVLYTQQGLNMSQATELSTQTMKMARIAGLEGAEATDLMTAALRGFNMELNEASAQRVNDVYSNLAAKAAANTHEIADAMTRTASIANAAGMEFETTAAFLTQMIETTRESAENLGTAMKTIVARFTEMKKAPGEIIEVDGEEVNVNKVEAALKSVGVQLRDTQGQFRDLDDVFLELSSKWDSLDVMSQRYVATMAAGSRQQSRFIAMMSNYQRTMELMGYATNSAGASQEQFEKTMDSLESKLNRLHDAWEQYVTGIANQSIIKGVVDLLTDLLETVNNVTDALDPLHTGWSKILAAFLGFKAAKGVVNGVLKGIGTQLGTRSKTGLDEKQGTVDGTKYGKGFWGAFQKMQTQKRDPSIRPIASRDADIKRRMQQQGLSTTKYSLLGKDDKAVKKLTSDSKNLKERSKLLGNQKKQLEETSKSYTKYAEVMNKGSKEKNFRAELLKTNGTLLQREEAYQKTLDTGSKEYAASQKRIQGLKEEKIIIENNKEAKSLENEVKKRGTVATNADTVASELNTEASEKEALANELDAQAKEKDALATDINTKITSKDTIQQEANNMTRIQAIAGLFSLNSTKRLTAAVSLGLMSAEEAEAIATKGATKAHTAFNAALYACPIMWIIAGVAALTAGLIALAVMANNNSLEKQLEAANENAEKAAKKAQELTDAYNDLLDRKDKYNSLQEELQVLQEGTIAFKEKVLEANQAVLDLLQNYPSLSKYVESKNGILTISDEGWDKTLEEQLKNVSDAQVRAGAAALYALDKQVEKDTKDTIQNIVKGTTYDKTVKQTSIGRVETKTQTTPYKASDFSQEDQKKLYDSMLSFYQKGEIARINEKDRQQFEERGYKVVQRDGVYYSISSEALNEVGQIGEVKLSDTSLGYLASSLEKVNENNFQKQSQINAATLGLATNVINSINPNINDKTKNSLGQFLANNFNQETFAKEIEKRRDYYGKGMYWGYGEYRGEASTGEGRLRYEYEQRTGLSSKDEEGNYIDIKDIREAMAAGDITEKYMGKAAENFEKLNKINKEAANNLLALGNTQVENLNITDKMGEILLGPNGAEEFVNNVTEAFTGSQELEDFAKSLGYASADSFVNELSENAKTIKKNYKQNIEDTYKVIYGGIKTQSIPTGMWDTQVTDYVGMQKSLTETFGTLQTALDYSNLFKDWKANSGIDFSGLFFNIDKSVFESGIYEELEKIDFSNPIQAASEINKLSASTNENWQKIGNNLKSYAQNLISTQNQFKQIFSSIDSKDWEKLSEDFTIDRDELNELKTELPELQTFLDNTGVSANTVSKYFTKLAEGTLSLYNTSEKFIEALDKINAGINNIEDSIDFVENFETSKTATAIGDSFSEYRETLQQSLERGQYGDLALIDYTKMILGNDNFDKYYNEFEGNLQKVEELAFEKINLWGENFYGLWTEFSKFSDVVNIGENGEINFDLSEINSIDDLSKLLQEKLNISDKVADAAIADAQTYSSNFSEALNQLSLGDAISTFLEGSFSFQGVKYINEQELNILADESGIDADKLKQEIQTALDNADIKYTFNAEPVLTDAGNLSEEIQAIIEKQMSDELQKGEINLDSYFEMLVSNGLSDEQARQEINNMLKDISDDFSNMKFEFSDGSLKKTEKTVGSTIADAVSNGEIDGVMSPAARYAQKKSAVEQGTETAKQIAKGIYLGYTMARNVFDENKYQQNLEKIYDILEDESEQTIADIKQLALEELGDTAAFQQIGEQVGNSFKNGFNANSYINKKAQEYGISGGKYDKDETKDTSSDSDSDWTNDYDKYYNTLKKIEGLERKRTELERQHSRLIKQRYLDEEKIKANKKEQVDLLKQQARINSDLANTAAAYLRGDSNGDVWFDEATGTIQTNPNAANYNEEQMEAFNDQKSLMEDHYETWKEAKDNLEDIYDAIDELTEIAEFSLEDLTDSVDRAIEVLDNTLTNLDREISRLDRYNSGATSSDYKKRYEQSAQTYADKYNQLTTKKAINEQKLNGQMYSEYGKYINVDWNTKEVTKSALYYAIVDPDVKDSVDDFVSEAQEIASNIIDMDNQQEEIKDSLYELQQTLADKSLEFQEKVYDAVVKAREDEITTLNNIDNSIKNAASDLISSVQKNLQKIRQDRQNQDKEEELQNMEARLAYYQVDTSNANQKNILDLQKQLEDKQRSYTDTLIDQKISELQQQNDDAAAQRKRQIEIMETQLELDKENGVIWKAVDNAIRTGFNSSGRIQKGSDLYNMLSSLDEVTKKNSVQFERWFGELNNLAAAYNANLTANLDTSGQMSNTVANANDVYGENSEYIKSLKSRLEAMNRDGNFNNLMWYDQEGQKMVYKYSHYYASSQTEADDYNKKVAEYQALARELANARAFYKTNKNASFVSAFNRLYGYDSGGLADYTGFAWLDGTPTSPEMVLSSKDTENFIQLKDILSNVLNGDTGKNSGSNGDYYFEIAINVDKVTSDYDVDQIADRIKQQITNDARYRNVNTINMIR